VRAVVNSMHRGRGGQGRSVREVSDDILDIVDRSPGVRIQGTALRDLMVMVVRCESDLGDINLPLDTCSSLLDNCCSPP